MNFTFKKAALYVIFVAGLFGAYELANFYFGKNFATKIQRWENTDVPLTEAKDSTVNPPPYNNTEANKVFVEQQGFAQGEAYLRLDENISSMRKDLEKSMLSDSQSTIAFKRAVYLKALASKGIASSSEKEKKEIILSVYNDLQNNLFRLPSLAASEEISPRWLRRIYVHVIDYVYQRSMDPQTFFDSNFKDGTYFKELVGTYGIDDKDFIVTMYIDGLYNKFDLPNNNQMVAQKMYALAKQLDKHILQIHPEVRKSIIVNLAELKAMYPTARLSELRTRIEDNKAAAASLYAGALGLMARHPDTSVTQEEAEQAFLDAEGIIKNGIQTDNDELHMVYIKTVVEHAEMQYFFNEKNLNTDIEALVGQVVDFREKFSKNAFFVSWLNRLLRDMQTNIASEKDSVRLFVELGMKMPAMKKLLDNSR